MNIYPLYLSIYISFITTFFLLLISIPLAWWFIKTNSFLKKIIEVFVTLPLVLPPTILGFYLLLVFNSEGFFGKIWFYIFGSNLMFSISGLIVGSIIYSLPFAVQPIKISFKKINNDIIYQALLLQKSFFFIFFKIILPLSKNGILNSIVLTFVHTLGEFGVVLMIGGNIPGKTQVISIAIYESVEMLNYNLTHKLSLIVLILSFIIIFILYNINKNEH